MARAGVVGNNNGRSLQDAAVNPEVDVANQPRTEQAFHAQVCGSRAANHVPIRGGQCLHKRCEMGPHLWLALEVAASKGTNHHKALPDPVPAQQCVCKLLICRADPEPDLRWQWQVQPQKTTGQGPEVLQGVTPHRRLRAG
jgi:hypothetical protein